jgi:hypothetical protein
LDSTIPFLFGIVEYIMIASISIPHFNHIMSPQRFSLWLWALTAFCLVSCVAYWNQHTKAIVDEDVKYVKLIPKRNLIQALVTALLLSLVALASSVFDYSSLTEWMFAACIFTLFIGHAYRINKAYERPTEKTFKTRDGESEDE